jgi:thiosulfate/3-mercaptopyruvate sulfurtransferase
MTTPHLLADPLPITADELEARLADSPAVLDVRPLAGYNGWRLGAETRGGHVPGAAAFPAAWLGRVEPPEVERILNSKGIVPSREVVLYGDADDVEAVANVLLELGHTALRVLDGGFAAWTAKPDRPIERLPRYQQLVHTDWLAELLAGGRPEAAPTGTYLVFHVNFGVPEEYAEGHIPGAGYLDTNWLEDPADWNRREPDELDATLRRLGISRETTVILYGRDTVGNANEKWPGRRAGQIAATRAASILRYAGVDDVRLLDGGYDWWVKGGHEVTAVPVDPRPVDAFGAAIPQRPELIVDIDDAKRIIADRDGAALVSVRTWKEHIGRVSGYNYIVPAGRIAGDVWGNCGSDAYHMQHYRNVDNTMRAYPEIAANWAEAGITPDKWVAFYCGTGWRASETWFYAWLMGWDRIAVYDGGWFEWSADPEHNPIEIGEPESGPGVEYAA